MSILKFTLSDLTSFLSGLKKSYSGLKNSITPSQIKDNGSCESSKSSNATSEIFYNLRLENQNWIIGGQLYFNSLRNKFDMLASIISNEIHVLLLSETKIDKMFPLDQFLIPGFTKPVRLGRNSLRWCHYAFDTK